MKKIFEFWWAKDTRCFSIINYKTSWKENGNKPRISFHTNGAIKSRPEDTCFDSTLIIGYTIVSYTNFKF